MTPNTPDLVPVASARTGRACGDAAQAAALAVALVVAGLGCASSKKATPEAAPFDDVAGRSTAAVVSGSPRADTAAFESSSGSLSAARHDRIQRMGPKPKGVRLPAAPATREAASPAPDRPGTEGATTVPTREEFFATTAPAAPTQQAFSRVPLADGRVRLIWHLRSFGGPKVAAGGVISGNTSRRQVSLVANDLAPLVAVIQGHLSHNGQVLPLPNENKLVITCAPDAEAGLLALLGDLDVPAPQVEITAKIFEVSHNFDYQQGARILANRIGGNGTQQGFSGFSTDRMVGSATSATPFQGSVVSLLQNFEKAGLSIDASFELLAEAGLIHVVSSPRLTVAEGQTGYMLAGQELPIQSVNIVNNVVQAATQYKPVGVQLYITPQAIGDGQIKLHTVSVVSSVSGFSPMPAMRGKGTQQDALLMNPIIDSREAETAVTVNDGETLVISGMRMSRTTTREDKVPGLGDIPLLGNLFKSHRSQQHLTDLYFFVTPTLALASVE